MGERPLRAGRIICVNYQARTSCVLRSIFLLGQLLSCVEISKANADVEAWHAYLCTPKLTSSEDYRWEDVFMSHGNLLAFVRVSLSHDLDAERERSRLLLRVFFPDDL